MKFQRRGGMRITWTRARHMRRFDRTQFDLFRAKRSIESQSHTDFWVAQSFFLYLYYNIFLRFVKCFFNFFWFFSGSNWFFGFSKIHSPESLSGPILFVTKIGFFKHLPTLILFSFKCLNTSSVANLIFTLYFFTWI